MTKLSDTQKDQIDNLIQYTILPALQEDVCIANMDDVPKSDSNWEEICEERMNDLYVEALKYLKNNLE
jgi:hypothetical protein